VSSPDVVFLVGAPRSGTTWLQHLLGAHPRIATPQETDLLDRYVASWLGSWRRQLADSTGQGRRPRGLPAILTEEQFLTAVRGVVEEVDGTVLERKPGARVVLDKNPYHAYHLEEGLTLLPNAAVVHLIRDGRDVACSLMRASGREWGRGWAPTHVDGAAALWREAVETARRARNQMEHYLEVRYEQLHSPDAVRVLTDLYRLCGEEPDERLAREALERFDVERVRSLPSSERQSSIAWGGEALARLGSNPLEPEGFLAEGRTETWRERFSLYDRWLFDRVAGDLLVELGYERDPSWVGGTGTSRALAHSRHGAARASYRGRRLLRR
jgi:hypothetical protein